MNQKEFEKAYGIIGDKFTVIYLKMGIAVFEKSFADNQSAWASGENWKLINPKENNYKIVEKLEFRKQCLNCSVTDCPKQLKSTVLIHCPHYRAKEIKVKG